MDHHCHLLRRAPAGLDPNEFRACFTEATDARVLSEHLPNTPLYRMLIRRLAPVFGCQPTESAVLTARRMLEPGRYARELMERSHTALMLLDTGFAGADVLTLGEQQAIVPIAQREIVRVETLAEELVDECRRPEDWLDGVREALSEAVKQGAVAVKTIVAYRASLRLRWPDHRDVREEYAALRRSARTAGHSRPRLTGNTLCHMLVFVAAEECVRLGVPLQVHCGLGDVDEDLAEASPLGLRPLLIDERFADLRRCCCTTTRTTARRPTCAGCSAARTWTCPWRSGWPPRTGRGRCARWSGCARGRSCCTRPMRRGCPRST